jgi:hypothetical protein
MEGPYALGRRLLERAYGSRVEERPRLEPELEAPRADLRYERCLAREHAQPRSLDTVLVEPGAHDVGTQLERAGLVEEAGPDPGAARVVHVDRRAPGVRHLDDRAYVIERHELVGHRQPRQHHERHIRLPRQRLLEGVDPARVDEPRADVLRRANDGGVAVALRDSDHYVPGPNEHEVGRERGSSETVEQRRVMTLGRAAEVGQGGRAEAVEIERRGEEVAREGQFLGRERQPVLEAGEVVDDLGASTLDMRSDVAPRLLQLAEVVLRAGEDPPASVRQAGRMLVPVPVGCARCDVDHVHGLLILR